MGKTRIAASRLSGANTTELQQSLGRFGFVYTGLYGTQAQMQATINGLRKVNPSVKIATYTNIVDTNLEPVSGSIQYQPSLAVAANDWWLYNAAGQHTTWTTAYNTSLVNITTWAPRDSAGRRYPQWLADHHAAKLGALTGLDFVYVDNVWYMPRPRSGATSHMDWKRNGTNLSNSDPEVLAAFRSGMASYWASLRTRMPNIKIFGNADNDLSYPEYKGKLNGALNECAYGKSWSMFNQGWSVMMARYRTHLANTAPPHDAILQGCSEAGLNLPMLRFGLASALLENGWFVYKVTGETEPYWADEYDAKLGAPAEAPPTAATASGIWMRKYTNGIVLVNPGTTTASVNIGSGYKRLLGTKDPVTNNGLPISTVTLLPNTGLIVVRQ